MGEKTRGNYAVAVNICAHCGLVYTDDEHKCRKTLTRKERLRILTRESDKILKELS